MARQIKVGITQGDLNGIGYEVIIKALQDERILELCTPVIFGLQKVCSYYRKVLDAQDFKFAVIASAADARDGECNIVNVDTAEYKITPGQPDSKAGEAALKALDCAAEALKAGEIDVLVTAPIDKHTIQSEEFNFPGHTEYLEKHLGDSQKAMMVLFNDDIKVALVTTHIPLKDVSQSITKEVVIEKISSLNSTLSKDFAVDRPKIAVLSLNPHSGDEGLLGNEEKEVISPAIEESFANGILAFGPYSADGFFGSQRWRNFDGVVAMYHDQGLAPFKTIAMETGVNFTACLPFVRTSPDHGTGYDIAGKGIADESSMRAAIYGAIDIYRRRQSYIQSHSNPLRKQYVDKSGDKEVIDLSKEEL